MTLSFTKAWPIELLKNNDQGHWSSPCSSRCHRRNSVSEIWILLFDDYYEPSDSISLNFHRIVYHTYRDIQLVEMNHVRNTRHVKTPIACLLQEAVRVKGLTAKRKAIRDLLSTAVGEYNKTQTNKVRVNWSSVEISSRFFQNEKCQIRKSWVPGLPNQGWLEEGNLWDFAMSFGATGLDEAVCRLLQMGTRRWGLKPIKSSKATSQQF